MSVADIMIEASISNLIYDFDTVAIAEKNRLELLGRSASDTLPLKELPFHHKDPFLRSHVDFTVSVTWIQTYVGG